MSDNPWQINLQGAVPSIFLSFKQFNRIHTVQMQFR
uniref:Uncharacterized protein n=1 Tax=Rhizophora mucronata TaxID=61149 RepID=A0A2P2PM28_RHIMU